MGKELLIKTNRQGKTIDSRDVAEMLGRHHGDFLKIIKGSGKNLGIIPVLEKGNLPISEYFIESNYKDISGKSKKCYECTIEGVRLILDKIRDTKRKETLYKWWEGNLTSKIKVPNTILDRIEFIFINKLNEALIPFSIKGIKQYVVLSYRIDYYIPELNVAIEYDENSHKHYLDKKDKIRQLEIEKELGCKFIRVSDKNSDEYNIGFVIKNILEVK